ncbi:carbon-nitrogen hydrolase [Nitzschia inconspicua]|uniref:Carbon-nitrogen hydrolase n=1 Tax=Nitzschia inconspicua TaxID=303405 RepID=A0A9K3Q416_9STRA|nr:carbon-nitrogen hydrolase [Nitzschia inconspicua]
MRKGIAAIAQLRSTSNKYHNLRDVAYCARLAVEQQACMLFLPECFGFLGESSEQTLAEAEDPKYLWWEKHNNNDTENEQQQHQKEAITSMLKETIQSTNPYNCSAVGIDDIPTSLEDNDAVPNVISILDGLRVIAQTSGLWISGGGLHMANAPVSNEGKPRVYNTHIIMDHHGIIRTCYNKIHLFDVDIPGQVSLKESATTAPGTDYITCENTPLGTLGLTTCYDVRFPEQFQTLRKMGADVLLVPSAFTVPTGSAHWHTLLTARAIETQCYVLAAAQYGRHNVKRTSFGHALAVDPWGTVLADAGGYNNHNHNNTPKEGTILFPPSIVTAEIDLDYLRDVRQRMPIETHRANALAAMEQIDQES